MDLKQLSSAWKAFCVKMNEQGVPMPMARYKGEGNPALTLVILSSALVIAGIVSKWSGFLGGVDMNNALQFFYASSTLFFGHSWVHKDGKGNSDSLGSSSDDKK